ncbi:MAG: HNH/ENDO VII family nuclease [Muribaculaceae bacterium]|nr:HNH/ENDO VII family nuclease [Muribaculaceae bacterium]
MEGLVNEIKPIASEQKKHFDQIADNLNAPLGQEIPRNEDVKETNNDGGWSNCAELSPEDLDKPLIENDSLSPEQKDEIKEKTGWSDRIVDHIKSEEEAAVYMDANLKENNGNLERTDIDWNAKVPQDRIDRMRTLYGDEVADKWASKTNMDLIKEGKAPYGPDGERVNLHHIGQKTDSPLAELTNTEHKKNDGILHDKTKSSEINREVFRDERQKYWMARYEELQKQ